MDDRLELFIAETLTRDDNVFRISSDWIRRRRWARLLALSKTAYERFAALDSTGRQP